MQIVNKRGYKIRYRSFTNHIYKYHLHKMYMYARNKRTNTQSLGCPKHIISQYMQVPLPLLRTRPDGIAIFPGVCAGFALVVQVLSWSKQRNFQIYVEKHHFLGRTSTASKYNTLL